MAKRKDPKKGTGKKPKGSGRRLYTDENPRDTVRVKYATPADARKTVAKVKKVNKPFARKIQILTVVEQRAKVAGKPKQAAIAKKGKEAIRRKHGKKRDKQPPKTKKYFRSTKSGAGMTKAGVARYRRENPGSKLKTAVTGKVKKGSKAAKRRKSYCARSAGQMKKFPKAAKDPNSRLRQARRRWKC